MNEKREIAKLHRGFARLEEALESLISAHCHGTYPMRALEWERRTVASKQEHGDAELMTKGQANIEAEWDGDGGMYMITCSYWFFAEKDLREAAEWFTMLADRYKGQER